MRTQGARTKRQACPLPADPGVCHRSSGESHPRQSPRRPSAHLRPCRVQGTAGAGDRRDPRRAQRHRRVAYRRRQEPLLPDPGDAAARRRAGGLTPDRPDVGPGRGAQAVRSRRRAAGFQHRATRARRDVGQGGSGRAGPDLPVTRGLDDAFESEPPGASAIGSDRRGRGALRQPVGSRFPA